MEFIKRYQIQIWILAVLALAGYFLFAYELKRTDHQFIFGVYTALFVVGLIITAHFVRHGKHWMFIFAFGLAFRLVFLFVTPHLSNDYFRFTWDGELQKDGISAFQFLPRNHAEYFESDPVLAEKYSALYEASSAEFPDGMNSKRYYSIYPTINQFVFKTASMIGSPNDGNLVVMRIWLLIAEIVSFFILRLLLIKKGKNAALVGLYWLNPLIIIEIVGNLHFDGFAIAFILLALYYLSQKKTTAAGAALALAICSKLNPVFFIGAVFKKRTTKTFILFSGVTVLLTVGLMAVILDSETFWNFKNSFGLYFAWFSFNAGPYAFIKEASILLTGVNISDKISLIFPIITLLLFIQISIKSDKKIHHKLLLLYVVYFSFSPVVHPWYLTVLIPFGILSGKLYPIFWSLLAFFTYQAYGEGFNENVTFVVLEYAFIYALMYVEHKGSSKRIEGLKYWLGLKG
ncbi:MAG: alpha-1,6-mannosyltransferase [Crocinitomicaceae bacterium]|jgi:alpha-1,6-mannosyltransferase